MAVFIIDYSKLKIFHNPKMLFSNVNSNHLATATYHKTKISIRTWDRSSEAAILTLCCINSTGRLLNEFVLVADFAELAGIEGFNHNSCHKAWEKSKCMHQGKEITYAAQNEECGKYKKKIPAALYDT